MMKIDKSLQEGEKKDGKSGEERMVAEESNARSDR